MGLVTWVRIPSPVRPRRVRREFKLEEEDDGGRIDAFGYEFKVVMKFTTCQ